MSTFVHNDSGKLYREVSPVGMVFTITPEISVYLRRGVIFMREFGEDNITVINRDELESEFSELSSD